MKLKEVFKSIGRAILPRTIEEKIGLTSKPMVFEIGEGLTEEQKRRAEEWINAYEAPKFLSVGIPFTKKEFLVPSTRPMKLVKDWVVGEHLLKPYSDKIMEKISLLVKEGVEAEKAEKIIIKRELAKNKVLPIEPVIPELSPYQVRKLQRYEAKELALTGLDVIGLLPMGRIAKTTKKAKKTTKIAKEVIENPPDEVIKIMGRIKTLIKKTPLSPEDWTKLAEKHQKTNKVVASLFREKIILPEQIPQFKEWGFTADEVADFIEKYATFGGKELNRIAQWNREIEKLLPPAASKILKTKQKTPAGFVNILLHKIPSNLINLWRASLTGQLSTAMRNAEVSGSLFTSRIFENALIGTTKVITGKAPARKAFRPAIEDVLGIMGQLSKKERVKIAKILEENPLAKFKLYSTPVSDVALTDKASKLITFFNRTQEFAVRNLVFDAVLREELSKKGINLLTAPLSKIPKESILKAVNTALDYTMAAAPKGFFQEMVKMWNKSPTNVLSVLLYPFPRYLSNAVRWVYSYTPLGITRFLNPKTRKLLLKGDQEAMRAMARVFMGTLYFWGAVKLRNSKYAGEKWYQLKIMGRDIDARVFGPLLPTYLFLAEAFSNPKNLGVRDYMEGLLGIRRLAGTTLFLVDWLEGTESVQGLKKAIKRLTQDFIGGFGNAWFVRTFQDIVAHFDKEEGIWRYTKDGPIWARLQAKVPYWSRQLPPYPSITRATPLTSDYPLLRQLTGLSVRKNKTFLEKEMEGLGISYGSVWPRTGFPEIDRLIAEKTGYIMEKFNQLLEENQEKHNKLNDYEKEKKIRSMFSFAKKEAKSFVLKNQAQWIANIFYEDLEELDTAEERQKYMDKLKSKGLLTPEIMNELIKLKKSNH